MLDVALSYIVPAPLASLRVIFPLDAAPLPPCTPPATHAFLTGSSERDQACQEQSAAAARTTPSSPGSALHLQALSDLRSTFNQGRKLLHLITRKLRLLEGKSL